MALKGGRFSGTATTKKSLYEITGITKSVFKHVIIRAALGNVGTIYVGGSTLTTAGVGAIGFLAPATGDAITMGPEDVEIDLANTYLIGTDNSDVAYVLLANGPGQS